jgi:cytochrome P450
VASASEAGLTLVVQPIGSLSESGKLAKILGKEAMENAVGFASFLSEKLLPLDRLVGPPWRRQGHEGQGERPVVLVPTLGLCDNASMSGTAGAPGVRPAPGPDGAWGLGNVWRMSRIGEVPFCREMWRAYGDLFRYRIGPWTVYVMAQPRHIERVLLGNRENYVKGPGYAKTQALLGNGLLASEGELWRRQRRTLQPLFTPKAIIGLADGMMKATTRMVERWEPSRKSGEPIDVHQESLRFAIDVIGRTMFSTELGEAGADLVDAYSEACVIINRHMTAMVTLPLWAPTPGNFRLRKALTTLHAHIDQLIRKRRAQGPSSAARGDLLDQLLAARDPETGEAMDEAQLKDEIINFFFAGHETSAEALTWTWYLLATHPEVEARLHAELDRVLVGRLPAYEDLAQLSYTRMVIDESMRLYPPVWSFPRAARERDVVDGFEIPAGALVFPCQLLTHHHPEFWPDPERFDPERFSPAQVDQRPKYAYYPFGAGARVCIGQHMALMELHLALATVASRYRLELVPGQAVEPISAITLKPSRPLWMRVRERGTPLS